MADLLRILDGKGCSYRPEEIRQSLARLEPAFVPARSKQEYSFCVPLFREMLLEQEPEWSLSRELQGK